MRSGIVVAVALALLGACTAVAYYVWDSLHGVDMSTHGIIALLLGAIFTLGLGAGLMYLVFYSARKGYDDEADNDWR